MDQPDGTLLRKRYRRLELIGRGGMASVFRGRDEALGRDVAIKMYPPATNALDLKRLEDEVEVVAGLSHHSLVSLFDAGVERSDPDKPRVYLVMELINGTDLQRMIAAGSLAPRYISQLGYDLAEALQYIHHEGVVHRDIKPSNIMMVDYRDDSTRARAKLTDFGIAQQNASIEELEERTTTGTAAYLSPEQVRRNPIGPPSDIYSLGLVLLECFTRELAFPGEAVESALARLQHDPAVPDSIAPEWLRILRAMTSRDPAARPTASQLVTVMRDLVIAETGRHKESARADELEAQRIEAVRQLAILDTPPEASFDRITRLAAQLLKVPIALISFFDTDRIWFKSHYGLDLDEVRREPNVLSSAISRRMPWIVEDASIDPHTLANPLLASELGLRFYAGIPLQSREGHVLGTLCVLDAEPRVITDEELRSLEDLAAMAMNELESRRRD